MTTERGVLCNIQAFILVFLDKFLLITITIYIILLYIGTIHKQFYDSHEKKIFYISLIINTVISVIATGLIIGIYDIDKYSYCYGSDTIIIEPNPRKENITAKKIKRIADTSFSFVLIVINLFCFIKLLITVCEKIKQQYLGLLNKNINIKGFYDKLLLLFVINGFTLLESILIINDKLFVPNDYIDLIYLLTYLVVDLIYSINETVL